MNNPSQHNVDHFDKRAIFIASFVWAMSDMSALTLSPYFPKFAAGRGVNSSLLDVIYSTTSIVELLLIPVCPKIISLRSPMGVLCLAAFALALVNLLWGSLDRLQDRELLIVACFVLRALQGAAMSLVETAASVVGLRSTSPRRVGEAMGYIFTARALGMLIGPVLGGNLAPLGYSYPGEVSAALIFVSGLCTLLPTDLVERDNGADAPDRLGMCDLLRVRSIPLMLLLLVLDMTMFTFLGPTMGPYLKAKPYSLDSGMVGVAFSCMTLAYALCNASVARFARWIGEEVTVAGSTVVLGVLFLALGSSPLMPFIPHATGFFFTVLVLLGFAVGGVVVPGQALMVKAAAGIRGDNTAVPTENFSDALSALSNYAFTSGAVLGPLFAITVKNKFPAGCTYAGFSAIVVGLVVGMAFHCRRSPRSLDARILPECARHTDASDSVRGDTDAGIAICTTSIL